VSVLISGGSGMSNHWWWDSGVGNFYASNATGRVITGDINSDGKFDITTLYDYGDGRVKALVWLANSNGSAFVSQW
jgi:hypothetical protein